jgi:hypothetical protein
MKMPQQGDLFVLLLIIAIAFVICWFRFKKWLYSPSRFKLPFPVHSPVPQTEAVRIMEQAGYQVICGKKRVPLIVEVDDISMDSRLFVDYFARRGEELYVVKVAKQRQPIQWTGSGVRERLLPYCYLFDETHGVLYVDVEEGTVRKIRMDIGTDID